MFSTILLTTHCLVFDRQGFECPGLGNGVFFFEGLQWPQGAQIVTSALLGQFSGHLGSQGHQGGKDYWFLPCLNPQQGLSEKISLIFAPLRKQICLLYPTSLMCLLMKTVIRQKEGFGTLRWGSWLFPCRPSGHNLLSLFTMTLLNQSLLFFLFSWHARVLFGKDMNGKSLPNPL